MQCWYKPMLAALSVLLVWSAVAEAADPKKIVFVAGRRSHGYGSHEHYAGCVLLAKSLQTALGDKVETIVHRDGWPKEADAFDGADTIVVYSDGGGGHPIIPHLASVDALQKKGVGLVCLHYAVEVPKGEPGDRFLDWIGGYFEAHWSVNPHWVAEFKEFPDHPITRGVKPFATDDEWYYHMRFRDEMKGVTPILTAIPPESTLNRPDGAHSGNPHVRAKRGQPQHVAWAAERPDGGRGFGFTGGHNHWNWGDENFRRVVMNAIAWTAKIDIPPQGLSDKPVTLEDLESNQDFEQPGNFNREGVKQKFKLQSQGEGASTQGQSSRRQAGPRPVAQSKVITTGTPGHAEELTADIAGAKKLYLVVSDAGDGFSCDWADWAEPRLIGPRGELKLTEVKWKSAASGYGSVQVNKNCGGQPLAIAGKSVEYGIGTHANSLIEYDLPEGYTTFKSRVGLDNGGTNQGCGSTVQFFVYTERPSLASVATAAGAAAGGREPEQAVAGLDVAEGLEATLFASEPDLVSVTNLDIDHRGRVWVCEVMNYRSHNGKRPEGDRILILEDTTGDGVANSTKVFYQGRDVDSAMGICVLGNKVIVAASPYILVFTDENGDDKPDRKEILFDKTGQPQHDHSAHSFVFGPDGKYYWNFGNTGRQVADRQGNVVVDKAGNRVVDNGKPYFGGMVFRCDPDGSNFETLGHNFRNNYEAAVDSFGTIWQSDNDDDGNRGVRINYVMEFGNFGYREEMTGAGWNSPRTNIEPDIPSRHWHLNDPGVVPNLLITGAGSPTGILVYEGRLLPQRFWDQVIHCDAGPNVVRAYPVQKQGAGYSAEIENLVHGARDNWFRPADACVAPDGSVFITDWYDPGVGGHAQRDSERGRIFRIAPPGHKYQAPKYDYSTPEGAAAALLNPALSVRYLAWTALHGMGAAAEPALLKIYNGSENDRERARALWLLGKIEGRGQHYVQLAAKDKSPDIRIVGIRLARQLGGDLASLVGQMANDPAAEVRRECAIALRECDSASAAPLWAELAARHDGQDRWHLEALGIAAANDWDACFDAWLKKVGDGWNTPAGRDIVWRARSAAALPLLAKLILDNGASDAEKLRYFRAFDFHRAPEAAAAKQQALFQVLVAARPEQEQVRKLVLERVGRVDVNQSPNLKQAIERALAESRGTRDFIDIVDRFNVTGRDDELLAMAVERPGEQLGVDAVRLLLNRNQKDRLAAMLTGANREQAAAVAASLAGAADNRAIDLLMPFVKNKDADNELRRQATRGVAAAKPGAEALVALAKAGELDETIKQAAAAMLTAAPWPEIRQAALPLFPLPPPRGGEALPPIHELAGRKGNVANGQKVYATIGQCAKCHVVGDQGKPIGPNLSEIGAKLSRPALYESILFPSAGISHSYETYAVALSNGNVLTGLKVSETDESLTLKNAEGIDSTVKKADIDEFKKLEVSIMPADLHQQMTVQELVDVVEYLTTLRSAGAQ